MSGDRRADEGVEAVHNALSGNVGGSAIQVGQVSGDLAVSQETPWRVPHEVPVASRRFVDREDERSLAYEVLEPGTSGPVRIAVFTGLPGVGKTAMARWFAASTAGDYAGGELYVDFALLRDADGTAVSDGLADCLYSLGVHEKVMPATLSGRASLYRTWTSEKPMLVVLDDVNEAAEARPFVPKAPGSAVLITSNRRLDELVVNDDAEEVPIEPLSEQDSAEMLRLLCERRDDEELRKLARWCEGLPVALGITAARLRTRPNLPVGELVGDMARADGGPSARGVPDKLLPVFASSYRALSPAAAELYRTLGLVPGETHTAELITDVLRVDADEVSRLLDLLAEAHLVNDDGAGRYRTHRLVRRHAEACARELPDADELAREVRWRTVRHFLRRAAFADRAVMGRGRLRVGDHHTELRGGADPFDEAKKPAMSWLDGERANLMAALRVAVEHGWNRQAWQLAEAMTALYVNRRYLTDWVASTRIGVTAAQLDNAPEAVARLRSFVSRALVDLGEIDAAREELDAALPLAQESGDYRLEASVWELFGRYHEACIGAVDDARTRAISSYRRAWELFGTVADQRGQAFVLYFLGAALDRDGDPDALETLLHARELIRAVPDQRMEGRALMSIGAAHARRGDREQARQRLQESVDLLVAGEDIYYEAQAQEELAEVAKSTGDRDLQRSSLARALTVHTRFGSPRVAELRRALEAVGS